MLVKLENVVVHLVGKVQTFQGRNGTNSKQSIIVVEDPNGKYPKYFQLSTFKPEVLSQVQQGMTVDIDAFLGDGKLNTDKNGAPRVYNNLTINKVQVTGGGYQQAPQGQVQQGGFQNQQQNFQQPAQGNQGSNQGFQGQVGSDNWNGPDDSDIPF